MSEEKNEKKAVENAEAAENSQNDAENIQNNEAVAADQAQEAQAQDETSALKAEIEKLQKDMLYLKADFENYKKRMIKERSDILKYGSENLIIALLDLLDNFERAMSIDITPENLQSFADGIKMISGEFKNTLNRFGVSEVSALGEVFNPLYHEAMGTEPSTEYKAGTISKVFTKPYKLHDRLIRPGRVIVAQEPAKDEGSSS